MSATNLTDINLDVSALVYNYLKTTHGLESLAKVYKKKFTPPALQQSSPSLQQVFDHFQTNAPVNRRLLLTPIPAKKVKKNSNNDANPFPKSENLKIPQKRKKFNDASPHSVHFLGGMNSLVYDYLKTIPSTVALAEEYRMKFNPPAQPQNYPNLQHVFDHYQETAPVKRRLSMNLLTSTPPAKKAKKNSNDDLDLFRPDKSTIPTNAIITIPQKKVMMKSDQEEDDFNNLMNSLVYNYLKTIPTTVSIAEQYRIKFNPPVLPKGFSFLEDIFSHFQANTPINQRLVLNLTSLSSDNISNDSPITNNKPVAVESINSATKALIREKTTVKKKREPSSAKKSNFPHATIKLSTSNASVINVKQEESTKKPIHNPNIEDKVGERKPQMHKPDSYNYNYSTTIRPLNSTSISTNVKKISNPTPAYLAWTRWDNSVSRNNPKQCFQCGRIFQIQPSKLKVHFYTHMTPIEQKIVQSGWEDVCYFCNKRFICSAALAMHFVIHIRERPFKCDVFDCGKTFTFSCNMKVHARLHSSNLAERLPFECGLCGQRFRFNNAQKNHVKVVHQGIRHKCSWCEATFSRKGNSRVHEKKFHPEEFKKESEKDE